MRDACGREITYLRLSVTDLCNFRCRYCMPENGVHKLSHREICSFEELRDMAAAAVECGVKKIRVTGGEPLVRRGVVDFCRMLAALPGLETLCLTTNGSALPALAGPLREAGVSRVNISLDTLRPEKFREMTRRGELEETLKGIRAAEDAGFERIKLNCVLVGGFNDGEIADFVELTRVHPWEVRFIELMPMGECADWDRSCFLPARTVLYRCPELQPDGSDGVAERYRLPGAPGTVGLITPMSHAFCGSCNRIRITADGRLKPCLHSREEIPLRGLRGEELLAAVRTGIAEKPMRHGMDGTGRSGSDRDMNEIGG